MNNITGLNNFYIPNTLDGLNGVESSIAGSSLLLDGSNSMLNNLNSCHKEQQTEYPDHKFALLEYPDRMTLHNLLSFQYSI